LVNKLEALRSKAKELIGVGKEEDAKQYVEEAVKVQKQA
jgi:hypothetical protein